MDAQLNQFDFEPFDPNRDRSPEQFHRYDYALRSALSLENSLDAVQRTAAYAHSLPGADEGVHGTWNLFPNCRLESFDLFVGNRCSLSLATYEGKHSRSPQHL